LIGLIGYQVVLDWSWKLWMLSYECHYATWKIKKVIIWTNYKKLKKNFSLFLLVSYALMFTTLCEKSNFYQFIMWNALNFFCVTLKCKMKTNLYPKRKKEANLSKCTIQWNLLVWKEGWNLGCIQNLDGWCTNGSSFGPCANQGGWQVFFLFFFSTLT
jgi:hypothetical protein